MTGTDMDNWPRNTYEIQYTKAAKKFFDHHESVRKKYELAIRSYPTGLAVDVCKAKRLINF